MLAAFGFGGVRVAAIPAGPGSDGHGSLRLGICRQFIVAMAATRRTGGLRRMAAVRASHGENVDES